MPRKERLISWIHLFFLHNAEKKKNIRVNFFIFMLSGSKNGQTQKRTANKYGEGMGGMTLTRLLSYRVCSPLALECSLHCLTQRQFVEIFEGGEEMHDDITGSYTPLL